MKYYLDIQFLGGQFVDNCQQHISRDIPGLALNFVKSGTIYLERESGERETVVGPAIFWTWEGRRFTYGPVKGSEWQLYWVQFIGPRARRLVEEGLFPICDLPSIQLPTHCSIPEKLCKVLDLYDDFSPLNHIEAIWLLEGIGMELQHIMHIGQQNIGTSGELHALAEEISNNPIAEYDYKDLASELNYSYSHFRRLFREFTGMSPRAFQLYHQMRLAARLITDGKSIKDVALKLGHENIHYFSRLFKSKIGLSPKNYKQSLANNCTL